VPRFCVVGDDVIIGDKPLAMLYEFILKDFLGVDINQNKSYSSRSYDCNFANDTFENHKVAEICKYQFKNGVNLTSLSPNVLTKGMTNPNLFPNLLLELDNLQLPLSQEGRLSLITQCDKSVASFRRVLIPTSMPIAGLNVELSSKLTEVQNEYQAIFNDPGFNQMYLYTVYCLLFEMKYKTFMAYQRAYKDAAIAGLYGKHQKLTSSKLYKPLEAHLNIAMDALEHLVGNLENSNEEMFDIYNTWMVDDDLTVKTKAVISVIKSLLVLEEMDTYLGSSDRRKTPLRSRVMSLFIKIGNATLKISHDYTLIEHIAPEDLSNLARCPLKEVNFKSVQSRIKRSVMPQREDVKPLSYHALIPEKKKRPKARSFASELLY
jgi:hypothetical protein